MRKRFSPGYWDSRQRLLTAASLDSSSSCYCFWTFGQLVKERLHHLNKIRSGSKFAKSKKTSGSKELTMSVVLLYRVQRVDKTLENIITFYGWQDSFVRNIKNIQSYFILLRGDKKFDKKGNGNWFQIVKEPAGTKPSWASALTTQNHSGSSWIEKMFKNEYSQRLREIVATLDIFLKFDENLWRPYSKPWHTGPAQRWGRFHLARGSCTVRCTWRRQWWWLWWWGWGLLIGWLYNIQCG